MRCELVIAIRIIALTPVDVSTWPALLGVGVMHTQTLWNVPGHDVLAVPRLVRTATQG